MLVEGQVDRDSAAGALEEVGVGSNVALGCWGSQGEEREEGDEGGSVGIHDFDEGCM